MYLQNINSGYQIDTFLPDDGDVDTKGTIFAIKKNNSSDWLYGISVITGLFSLSEDGIIINGQRLQVPKLNGMVYFYKNLLAT